MAKLSRRLYRPRTVRIESDRDGVPVSISGTRVECVREQWLVEDGWWTTEVLRRRYFELLLVDGQNAVVFRNLIDGRWFIQPGA